MEVDETWCFLGDAAYATQKNGQTVYNAERLLAEIRVLKNVRAPHFFLSHSEPFQQNKEDVLEWMEAIYEKRDVYKRQLPTRINYMKKLETVNVSSSMAHL